MATFRSTMRSYQNVLISAAILLFCIVGFVAALVPSLQKVLALGDQARQLSEEGNKLSAKLKLLNDLDEVSLRQQYADLISAVPSEKSLPTIFSTVEGIAVQTNVAIDTVTIGGDTSISSGSAAKQTPQERLLGSRTLPFSVTIEGQLPAVRQFIALTPRVRRLLRLRTFSMSFPPDDRPVSISLQMDAFYEPLPTSLGKASEELTPLSDADLKTINLVSQLPAATSAEVSLPPPSLGAPRANPFAP